MKKCYIAGKVTGLPEKVYQASFRRAEIAVAILGYEPVNPLLLPHNHDKLWASYMRESIAEMMTCDVLYALHDWQESRGACIELQLAKDLGMDIIYQETLKLNNDE